MYRPYKERDGHSDPKANFTIGYELTTPVAYLTSAAVLKDVFKLADQRNGSVQGREYYNFADWQWRSKAQVPAMSAATYGTLVGRWGTWVIFGAGPDKLTNNSPTATLDFTPNSTTIPRGIAYDPTNGTVSNGDIYRSEKYGDGGLNNPSPVAGD
jgi:hypothetical protein